MYSFAFACTYQLLVATETQLGVVSLCLFFSFFLRFFIIFIHLYPVLGLKEYTLKYKTIFSPKSLVGCSFLTLRLGNNPQPLIAQLFLVHKPVVLSFWDFVTNRALQNQAQSLITMDV